MNQRRGKPYWMALTLILICKPFILCHFVITYRKDHRWEVPQILPALCTERNVMKPNAAMLQVGMPHILFLHWLELDQRNQAAEATKAPPLPPALLLIANDPAWYDLERSSAVCELRWGNAMVPVCPNSCDSMSNVERLVWSMKEIHFHDGSQIC